MFVEMIQPRSMTPARLSATTDESVLNANNEACSSVATRWDMPARLTATRMGAPSQCGYCTLMPHRRKHRQRDVSERCTAPASYEHHSAGTARVVTMENGRATGVRAVALDPYNEGGTFDVMIRAPRVIVAAGGIQSPALLLRSGLELPQLGRNLYLHPTTAVPGVYDTRIEPWSGPPQTIVCNQFATMSGNFGFRLEAAPTHPGLLGLAWPWINGNSIAAPCNGRRTQARSSR
jgi:hypothetical protein